MQNYLITTDSRGREVIRRREADTDGLPPAKHRITSPYDTDTRWAAKGDDLFWNGYKVHLTETCYHDQADAILAVLSGPVSLTRRARHVHKAAGLVGIIYSVERQQRAEVVDRAEMLTIPLSIRMILENPPVPYVVGLTGYLFHA